MKKVLPNSPLPLKLHGFNNLSKSLAVSLFDFFIVRNELERNRYLDQIHNKYGAEPITHLLKNICSHIGAKILAVSDQNYAPWGASSLVLMSEMDQKVGTSDIAMHLDKSHISAHTYPDFQEGDYVSTFRIDIHITSCGNISPLKALNQIIEDFNPDLIIADYTVRGYTRDKDGHRIFLDHPMESIQDFIDSDLLCRYLCADLALPLANTWQSKFIRRSYEDSDYFLESNDIEPNSRSSYEKLIVNAMEEIAFPKSAFH